LSIFKLKKEMQVTIFGSTGMVGRHLVKQALWMGYKVVAFARDAQAVFVEENENLIVQKGYLLSMDDIEKAIKNSDAICSALGGGTDGMDKTRSIGAKNIAMAAAKTNAFLCWVAGMGILPTADNEPLYTTDQFPAQFKAVSEEHYQAYKAIQERTHNFTVFCPGIIMDEPFNEKYTMQAEAAPGFGGINGGNLAHAMLMQARERQYAGQRVGIINL
jgi:uncharacterized protein